MLEVYKSRIPGETIKLITSKNEYIYSDKMTRLNKNVAELHTILNQSGDPDLFVTKILMRIFVLESSED